MTRNLSLTYTPTFMEKLLGRQYKWWYVMIYQFKSRTSSLFDSALFVIGHLLVVLGTMITWWLANNKIIDFDLQQKWVYFLVGELFFALIFTFSEYWAYYFIKGLHTKDLLKPMKFMLFLLFDSYGQALPQNFIKVSILSIIFIIFINLGIVNPSWFSLLTLFLAPFSLFILFIIGFIVSCSGFYLTRVQGVTMNYTFLMALLMGRVFPLNLLIDNFQILLFNPFAYLFYHPMQIYLGNYDLNQTIWVFVGGIAWCIVLYLLARLVFKLGLKRNESVGL